MFRYLLYTFHRLLIYSLVTTLMIVGVYQLIVNVWMGIIAVYSIISVLWIGFYYWWNLITLEITVDIMQYLEHKYPDENYFTIPRILERIKIAK